MRNNRLLYYFFVIVTLLAFHYIYVFADTDEISFADADPDKLLKIADERIFKREGFTQDFSETQGCLNEIVRAGVLHQYYVREGKGTDILMSLFPNTSPVTTSMVTRSAPRGKIIQAKAGKQDTLFEVHLKLRNMTNTVYRGLNPESFKLTGYVRGFPVVFTPEIMEPYDYGSRKTYTVYDMNYYLKNQFAPLHQIDMLLVFRVKPFLRDWELQIEPQWNDGAKKSYYFANYPDEEDEKVRLCSGTFQFLRECE